MTQFLQSMRSRRGATAVEYLVMLILAALFVLGAIKVFGGTVKSKYSAANDELSGTLASEDDPNGQGGGENGAGGGGGGGEGGKAAGGQGGAAGGGQGGGAQGGGGKGGGAQGGGGKGGGAAGGGGKGGGAAGGGGSGKDGVSGGDGQGDGGNVGGAGGGKKKKEGLPESDVNPVVILAAMALLALLFYVMASGKKD